MNRFKLVHDEYEMKHYIVDTLTKNTNKKVVFESEDENLADEIRVLLNDLNDELNTTKEEKYPIRPSHTKVAYTKW